MINEWDSAVVWINFLILDYSTLGLKYIEIQDLKS